MSNPIKGFFYIIGSDDMPIGLGDRDDYGFDGSSGPIFKYSKTDILNFFYKPYVLSKFTGISDITVPTLILDTSVYTNLAGYKASDIESKGYNQLIDTIECIYHNQTALKLDPTILDSVLVQYSKYKGSLVTYNSIYVASRLSRVKFKFEINAEIIDVEVYLTPDDYIYDKTLVDITKYEVYETEFHLGSKTNAFNEKIEDVYDTEKQLRSAGLKLLSSNYKSFLQFNTTRRVFDINGNMTNSYTQLFFILTHLDKSIILSDYMMVNIIKKYLYDKYKSLYSDNAREKLKKEYPDLFTNVDVNIYPLMNYVNNVAVDTIHYQSIYDELERRSEVIIDPNSSNVELFFIEGMGKGDVNDINTRVNGMFRIPLLAVNNTDLSAPISEQFPDYKVRYNGMTLYGDSYEQFSIYLKILFKVLLNINDTYDWSTLSNEDISIKLNLDRNLDIKLGKITVFGKEVINDVSFNFLGVTYKLYHTINYGEFVND